METIETIYTRKSTRKFADTPISQENITSILKAGMSGPSCVNAKDWAFLVVTDKDKLKAIAEANGAPATPLKGCALGVMVLGDYDRAYKGAKDYWIIDGAIAGQNMILAAQSLGIGSVWLGTYPELDRVDKQRNLLNIPQHLIPHSILAFGYPQNGTLATKEAITLDESKVYYESF